MQHSDRKKRNAAEAGAGTSVTALISSRDREEALPSVQPLRSGRRIPVRLCPISA
jgi:hypothetical protein